MSFLLANLPPIKCFVRKEYLYDLTPENENTTTLYMEGELTPCIWVSVKSKQRKALIFEAMLTEYGALYDKLPLSAFVWKEDIKHSDLLPLDFLEIWDAFSYYITVIEKTTLSGLKCAVFAKDKKMYHGEYLFTIDSCHPDDNVLNTGLSEIPDGHKSFNIIKLDNGQFAAQPNNRITWFDQTLISDKTKQPDFKVSTHDFAVENYPKWSTSETEEYLYEFNEIKKHKIKKEK